MSGVTTTYIGNYFEWAGSTSTMKKYYYSGGIRVAMRTGTNNPLWLLGDHLGSTSTVANFDGGSVQSQQLYKPWGEKRYPTGAPTLPTTFRYTGQRSETGLGPSGGEGLYFYNARWYDSYLNRWIQPDQIIPDLYNTQDWDRYTYVRNNPVRYNDPSGHMLCDSDGRCAGIKTFTRGLDVIKNRAGKGVPWDQLSDEERSALTWVGETQGSYGDIANTSNEDVTWSLEDPFNRAYWSIVGFITAFKAIPQAVTTIALYLCGNDGDCTNEFDIGSHALQRMAERGISIEQVKQALQGQEFIYWYNGNWQLGYYDPNSQTFVGVFNNIVTTVIQGSRVLQYIQNLIKRVP